MAYECLIYQKLDGAVALITLNRPQRLNALSKQLLRELYRALGDVEEDPEVRAVVITGAPRPDGRPCFCAGDDLKEIAAEPEPTREEAVEEAIQMLHDSGPEADVAPICRLLQTMSTPSIAAIDGVCTAGGIQLSLFCDFRVVSESAQVSDLEIKNLGSIGNGSAAVRLSRLVGAPWAKEMLFTGEPVDGHLAVQIGFANHVFPPGKLIEGALTLARSIARVRPQAVAITKAIINASLDMELTQALHFAYSASLPLTGKEGAQAFAQKKSPPYGQP
ncbi:MAG: enoyl-CoA hydratase/isomerase family protein [Chloroflexi bacterium]|nr:enoyl-CoA hydratase/isomerase family protein [Chloroflexota bacterium]